LDKKTKEKKMKIVYQVLNDWNNPASNDLGDLCIFPTKKSANEYIDYLLFDCNVEGEFKVVKKILI
jgi:hypothetical protein